jgi:hypothetical protein
MSAVYQNITSYAIQKLIEELQPPSLGQERKETAERDAPALRQAGRTTATWCASDSTIVRPFPGRNEH